MIRMGQSLTEGMKQIAGLQNAVLGVDKRLTVIEDMAKEEVEPVNATGEASFGGPVVSDLQKKSPSGVVQFRLRVHFENGASITPQERMSRTMQFFNELGIVMSKYTVSKIEGEFDRMKAYGDIQ